MSLQIRPYRDGDEAELVSLFARVFGSEIDLPHWRWKLTHAWAGFPGVLLALDGERPVFQYAGIPTPMLLNGAAATAMVSVDTMTDPAFRRRGLLTQVGSESYSRWREAGVDLVLGLPNEQWGGRKAALGWKPLFGMQRLIRPLHPELMLARRLSRPGLRRLGFLGRAWNRLCAIGLSRDATVKTRIVTTAGAEFDRLWTRCREDARFAVVRDARWVQWRFLSCPSQRYEVRLAMRGSEPVGYSAHYLVESEGRRTACLAELSFPRADERAGDALLLDLMEALCVQQVEHLSTLAVPSTSTFRRLRRHAFLAGPSFSVEMVPLSARASHDELCRPEHWELSGAAFDVI